MKKYNGQNFLCVGIGMFQLTQLYKLSNPHLNYIYSPSLLENVCKDNLVWTLEYGQTKRNKEIGFKGDSNTFEYGVNYYAANNEQKEDFNSDVKIIMKLSGINIRRRIRHLTNNIESGKGFDFNIFGHIMSCSNNEYSLKPYAIWFVDGINGENFRDNID